MEKYEIIIRQLTPFTEEELKEESYRSSRGMDRAFGGYADKPFHEVRTLHAEVSKEEFEAVKKAIIGIM